MKRKTWLMIGAGLAGAFIAGKVIAKRHEEPKSIDDDNEYLEESSEQLDSHSDAKVVHVPTTYEKAVKPALDSILSFGGLVLLSPVYAIITLAIKIDDPGPVFFTQKRVGKDKHFFCLHKFRTMKMSTPHDVPTHMLANPDQYITRVGRFLRKTSLDELPQIWDIYRQKMSIIGPRPALWNQADLVAERDKYGANDVLPGLTGWAQINGRDELEIVDKARLDGEYVERMSLGFDVKCFLGTIKSVVDGDGVVEGGTGTIHERDKEVYTEDDYQIRRGTAFPLREGVPAEEPETDWGFKKSFDIDKDRPVRVLITGAGSYIGTSFEEYVKLHYPNIEVSSVDMIDGSWRDGDWSAFDTVFHVAGIAHADVENVDDKTKELYYTVNTDLALEVARKAKESGIKQFIFMSSMIVYGGKEYIDSNTIPSPANFYGDSKWQADKGLRKMAAEDSSMKIAVLRPPMIYGKGSKGNYPVLAKIAKHTPIFPKTNNKRSMLYIENLCEFVSQLAISGFGGVYVPQNKEYSNTGELVKNISKAVGKKMYLSKVLSPAVVIANHVPGKIQKLAEKAFGSSWYDQRLSVYDGLEYNIVTLTESIDRTEG